MSDFYEAEQSARTADYRQQIESLRVEVAALREENARLTPDCGSRLADYRRELNALRAEVAALRDWQARAARAMVAGTDAARFCWTCASNTEWPHAADCEMRKLLASAEGER